MFIFLKRNFCPITSVATLFGGRFLQKRPVTITEHISATNYSNSNIEINHQQLFSEAPYNLYHQRPTVAGAALMDEAYFLQKFEEYERNDSWDQIFHKINLESDTQAKKLNLHCDLSNTFHEKNRYRNVLPYDQYRIVLKNGVSSESDSYINASPLHLPFARRNYILTQGPLPNTAADFWQMVYEQDVSICIMLSKVLEKSFIKCHSYFPCKADKNKKLTFGNFECELEEEEVKANYIIRRIRLTPLESFKKVSSSGHDYFASVTGPSHRTIHHFQFTTWPDFGVPEHTDHFLDFLGEVRTAREKLLKEQEGTLIGSGPPILCHCSAGIGRTGTFVIVDSILSMFEKKRNQDEASKPSQSLNSASEAADQKVEKQLDSLESLVIYIRRHRMGLIQTPQQLRFCWKTIVDWIKKNRANPRNSHSSSPKALNESVDQQGKKSSPTLHNSASPPDIISRTSPDPSPEIAAAVTDIQWSMSNDPLTTITLPDSSVTNSNNGGSTISPQQSDENNTTWKPSTNNSVGSNPLSSVSASSTTVRARKRSSNERDELASASIILPNSSSASTSPRPLSIEQQKRKETVERIRKSLRDNRNRPAGGILGAFCSTFYHRLKPAVPANLALPLIGATSLVVVLGSICLYYYLSLPQHSFADQS